MRVVLSGPIAVGKSTVMNALSAQGVRVFPEPIEAWEPLFSAYLREPERFAFAFQLHVAATRCRLTPVGDDLVVHERGEIDERVFTRLQYELGRLTEAEFTALEAMRAYLPEDDAKYILLLDTPEACYARSQARARPGEEVYTLDYFTRLDALYRMSFPAGRTVIVDVHGFAPEETLEAVLTAMK